MTLYQYSLRDFIPDPSYKFDHAGRVYHQDKNGTLRRLKGQALNEFNKLFLEELKKLKEKEAQSNEIPDQVRDDKL
ncbi:MAG: hypothetical protein IT281_05415 [Ignavibacteria bacterium]|nr:hypothetical protein [Ignavibacteria bacterium]